MAMDSYVHVYNRGAKRMPIFRQENDLLRLVYNLFYLNNQERAPEQWSRDLLRRNALQKLEWPEEWGSRNPLVSILAFSIMSNHFHLFLKPLVEGGVSQFVQRVCMSYSKYINEKYDESGSLFQGPFKSRLITEDFQFQYLAAYIMVKNPFELYPGGLETAIRRFDDAFLYSSSSPLNSLGEYMGTRENSIVTKDLLGDLFTTTNSFKEFAHECMLYKLDQLESVSRV